VGEVRDLLAEVSFRLRNAVPWSAPAWKRSVRSFDRVIGMLSPEAQRRAEVLAADHDLERWPSLLTASELHENLYLLDVLVQHLPAAPVKAPGLDVGSKDGANLPALYAFAPRPWHLVELDAHRRYLDLSTRRAHGERMAAAFPGCRYFAGSVTALDGHYGVVLWFLPFVVEGALRAWGLPRRFFAPEALFRHVIARVAPGGVLLVLNQGEGERDAQRALFDGVGASPVELGLVDSPLSLFQRPRWGFRWVRPRSWREPARLTGR
jgi:hypothetical protein